MDFFRYAPKGCDQNRSFPKFVTKYFKVGTLEHLARGSLQFGTLSYYASQESRSELGPRHDPSEPVLTGFLNSPPEGVNSPIIPGVLIQDPNATIHFMGTKVNMLIDGWTLCFCEGEYSSTQHANMRDGVAGKYAGDKYLVGAVTFDTVKLLNALAGNLMVKFDLVLKNEIPHWLFAGHICYNCEPQKVEVASGRRIQPDVLHKVFCKPSHFRTENEFRIALDPTTITAKRPLSPLVVDGPEILDSITFGPTII